MNLSIFSPVPTARGSLRPSMGPSPISEHTIETQFLEKVKNCTPRLGDCSVATLCLIIGQSLLMLIQKKHIKYKVVSSQSRSSSKWMDCRYIVVI